MKENSQVTVVFLVLSLTLFHSTCGQITNSCPMIAPQTLSTVVAMARGEPVNVEAFQVVCLSSGLLRDTYSSASVLVTYTCSQCMGTLVEQFTFYCNGSAQWSWDGEFDIIRMDPSVDLSTVVEKRCSLCIDPGNFDGSLQPYDNVTHCISKSLCV